MEEARKVLLKAVKKDNFPLGDDREDALDVESQLEKEIEELKNKKQEIQEKYIDDLKEINFKITEKEEVLTSLRNERKFKENQAVSSEAEKVITVHDSTPKRPQKTPDSLGSNYGAQALQKPNFNFFQNYPKLGAAPSLPTATVPPNTNSGLTLIAQHNHQYNLYGLGKLILTDRLIIYEFI